MPIRQEHPTTWLYRVQHALMVLCDSPIMPTEAMVLAWFTSDDESLQQWVHTYGTNMRTPWVQGIAVIDAATVMADNPCEGEGHAPRPDDLCRSVPPAPPAPMAMSVLCDDAPMISSRYQF